VAISIDDAILMSTTPGCAVSSPALSAPASLADSLRKKITKQNCYIKVWSISTAAKREVTSTYNVKHPINSV